MNSFNQLKNGVIMLCALVFLSCNEELPVREDINNMITTTVTSSFIRESSQNNLRFYVTVKNNTDETIEERTAFGGTVEVRWMPAPDVESPGVDTKRTLMIGSGSTNIFRAPGYNQSTAILTLKPNDSIVFYVTWNMRSNDSSYLPRFWTAQPDYQCNTDLGLRRITLRQKFLVTASIKMFDKLAVLYSSPTVVSNCFVAPYLRETNPSTNPCTNINIVDPCVIVGE